MSALDNLPSAVLAAVTHVGTLNPADKRIRGDSQEGAGLSVSCHPEAWVRIAGLGGLPWWETDVSHLKVIDGHAALKKPGVLSQLRHWAEEAGWATRAMFFKVRWLDSETEKFQHILVATREEAEDECEGYEEEDRATICPIKTWAPTQSLLDRMVQSNTKPGAPAPLTDQWLLAAWANEHGWDGLWWKDTLAPARLSAPRGVLFPDRLSTLTWKVQEPPLAAVRSRPKP